jgi:sterol desaturase/sphingolipid hydroxylase (fatty acid hydroxylase superfamily)
MVHIAINAAAIAGHHRAFADHAGLFFSCALLNHPTFWRSTEFTLRALLLALATLLIEIAVVGWAGSSARALLQPGSLARRDAVYTLLSAVLGISVLSAVSSFGTTYAIASMVHRIDTPALIRLLPWAGLQLIVLVLGRSFVIYWQHRVAHLVPFLWEFHKFHHSATEMTALNDFRNTPLTIAMNGSVILVYTQLAGSVGGPNQGIAATIAAALYLVYLSAIELNAHMVHSKWNTDYGWFGKYILASPNYHFVHHSALPRHRDKNFSTDFVIWDWLFGTRAQSVSQQERESVPLGFDDNLYNARVPLWDYLLQPAIDAAHCVARVFKSNFMRSALQLPEPREGRSRSGGA